MGSNENTKLCDFTSRNNSNFICTPIAPLAPSAPSYEIKPALLNLVMKEQFSGAGEDVALHLNNFVDLCDMRKYKEVDCDIGKYYPPAKIIQLRSNIMNFRQLD